MTEWRVTRASAVGPAHEKAGAGKQDMGYISRFRRDGQPYIAVAAADGASSAPQSETGAKLAVDQAVKSLKKDASRRTAEFGHATIRKAISDAREQIKRTATSLGQPIGAYHTTLLALLIGPDKISAGQTGDGGIVIQRRNQPDLPAYAVPPQHGENKGETRFITGPQNDWQPKTETYDAQDIAGIAVFTDGLDPACIQNGQPLPGFFTNLFDWHRRTIPDGQRNQDLAELIVGPQLRNVSRDDVTLIVLTRDL